MMNKEELHSRERTKNLSNTEKSEGKSILMENSIYTWKTHAFTRFHNSIKLKKYFKVGVVIFAQLIFLQSYKVI